MVLFTFANHSRMAAPSNCEGDATGVLMENPRLHHKARQAVAVWTLSSPTSLRLILRHCLQFRIQVGLH